MCKLVPRWRIESSRCQTPTMYLHTDELNGNMPVCWPRRRRGVAHWEEALCLYVCCCWCASSGVAQLLDQCRSELSVSVREVLFVVSQMSSGFDQYAHNYTVALLLTLGRTDLTVHSDTTILLISGWSSRITQEIDRFANHINKSEYRCIMFENGISKSTTYCCMGNHMIVSDLSTSYRYGLGVKYRHATWWTCSSTTVEIPFYIQSIIKNRYHTSFETLQKSNTSCTSNLLQRFPNDLSLYHNPTPCRQTC